MISMIKGERTRIIILTLLAASIFQFFASAISEPSYDTEEDCRVCHGNVVDRHHLLMQGGYSCTDCHQVRWENGSYQVVVIRNCLICHISENHSDCIVCHASADVNITKFARHANVNTSDSPGVVSNSDCWTCHYIKDMNRSNVYLCESCHINSNGIVPVTDPSLIITDFTHGMTTCKLCHAPRTYHNNGTVGPLGVVENVLRN